MHFVYGVISAASSTMLVRGKILRLALFASSLGCTLASEQKEDLSEDLCPQDEVRVESEATIAVPEERKDILRFLRTESWPYKPKEEMTQAIPTRIYDLDGRLIRD